MAAPGDTYERELKNLLSGETKTIEKMVKTCDDTETRNYRSLIDDPFMVVRAAGSLGVDLVVLRGDYSFPIEVKSSCDETMHFSRSPRLMEQALKMKAECSAAHVIPIYAMRLKNQKGDPWRIFHIPLEDELKGSSGLLQRHVPPLRFNENKNYIMKWSEGIKLSELIEYMQFRC